MRKGREDCHSSGRVVNWRVQSHPPIPDQTASGLAGRLQNRGTAGSSRAYGNARLSCTRRDRPPPPFPLRLSQFWRTTACAFPKYSPHLPDTKREPRGGDGRARHSQAGSRTAQLHRTLPPPSLPPSVRSPPLSFSTRHCRILLATQTRAQAAAGYIAGGARTAGEERETRPEEGAGFGLPGPGGSGIRR